MLHEIGEKDFCRQYVADAVPRETDVVLVFGDGTVLFNGESLARLKDVELENPEVLRYLFSISGVRFFWSEEMLPEEGALHYESLRTMRRVLPRWLAFGGMTGYHLAMWYENNRFCGRCATALEPEPQPQPMFPAVMTAAP